MADEAPHKEQVARDIYRLVVSTLLTAPLLANLIARWLGWRIFFLADPKIQFIWATLVLVVVGRSLYPEALRQLRAGRPNLDVLAALGSTVAYALMHYEGAALILTATCLVKVLAAIARDRSGAAK